MQALVHHHSQHIANLRLAQPVNSINAPIRFIFLGPPGAGKGTHAAILSANWQIPHLSTGDMLRQAIAKQTELGLQVQTYVDAGELVPDLLLLNLLEERLSQPDTERGWILDGFPRNLAQAEALEDLLHRFNQPYDLVVHFEVTHKIVIERISQYRHQGGSKEIIWKLLEIYQEQALPVLNFYQYRQNLYSVNGNLPIESVARILEVSLQPDGEDVENSML